MSFEKLLTKLNDLPVSSIAGDVTHSVLEGNATTLASETGSGKTLVQSTHLSRACSGRVHVLMPRRFLAVNAAETVAALSEVAVGEAVGYAVGTQTGDRSCFSAQTKLLFVTNGYALASGLVHTATNFVLDEVHETSLDLSIIRALIYRRIAQGERINVLEMSATLDPVRQAAYWESVTKTRVFTVNGKTFDCELRHRKEGTVAEAVMELIAEGRRGILACRPGVGEVAQTAAEIANLAVALDVEVEVAQIYGDMNYAERQQATQPPPEGVVKVLVGTNVVESGANIPWLDAGVSCGTGKEMTVRERTGASALELIDLPQWRLAQQEGRVKRFCPGVFVLCSPKSFTEREVATRPEIERLALTELVLHCAALGLRAHELVFDYAPLPSKIEEAEQKLQQLGLIDAACALTSAGKFSIGLPVGPETAAMLWHAKQIDCLGAMVPLAALIEVGGIRKYFRQHHHCYGTSDYLDGLAALGVAYQRKGRHVDSYNVGYTRYMAAIELMRDVSRRLSVAYVLGDMVSLPQLRQCILAGSLDRLYVGVGVRNELVSVKSRHVPYRLSDGCVMEYVAAAALMVGDLRSITPRDTGKEAFTVLEHVTLIEVDDLYAVAKLRPEVLVLMREQFEVGGQLVVRNAVTLFGIYTVWQKLTPLYLPKKKEIVPGVTTADFFDVPRRSPQRGKRRR